MRVELATEAPRPNAPRAALSTPPKRIDRFDLAVLGVFAAISVWVLGLDLWQVIAHGRVWTGTDGIYVVDQMQYLAWIRSASHHLLASNLFVLHSTPADYFQPAVAISAGAAAAGMAPWLSLLLWQPGGGLAAFFSIRAFAPRPLTGLWGRRVAFLLRVVFESCPGV